MNAVSRQYFPPGPVASAFFRSNARRRCLLGPFASGKSVACCIEILDRIMRQRPNAEGVRKSRWVVVRNTYDQLKNTTVRTWKDWAQGLGQFIEAAPFEHRIRGMHPSGDGTSIEADVIFLAMDREEDGRRFLSLEITGIYFNEIRELRQSIINAGDGRIGRFPSMRDGGPTWHGMIADTNMPDEDHWLYPLAQTGSGWEFFHQPGGLVKENGRWVENKEAENLANVIPGYYTQQLSGKSEEWISVYLGAEWGRIPEEGSYYAEEMKNAERSGRIRSIAYDPSTPVHTFWDLGIDDYMSIWCGQNIQGRWNWLHYYENTGMALGHYSEYLATYAKNNGWGTWGNDVWPHDGTQRVDGSGERPERRCDIWKRLTGRQPKILERAFKGDQIEACRNLIATSNYDQSGCLSGLKHLRRYSRERDEVRNVFKKEPRHDEHSHCADAHMVAAIGQKKISNDVWRGSYHIENNGMQVA